MRDRFDAASGEGGSRDHAGSRKRRGRKSTAKSRTSTRSRSTSTRSRTSRPRNADGTFRDPASYSRGTRSRKASRSLSRPRNADGTFKKTGGASRGRRGPSREARDPAWFGDSQRHACAGSLSRGRRRTRRDPAYGGASLTVRDPAWFGDKRRHAAAARLGWETRGGAPTRNRTTTRSRTTRSRTVGPCGGARRDLSRGMRDPAWFGERERHSFAAEQGWRRVAKKGWTPKRYNPKEDGARDMGPTRRTVPRSAGLAPLKAGSRGRRNGY